MTFTPTKREELVEWLKSRKGEPFHIGNSQDQVDSLDLGRMNKVVLYEPEETIICCEAGITLIDLEEKLTANGQWVAGLVASERTQQTLGAALAADDYHPRIRIHTPLRTSVLGGWFLTTDGRLFRSGSRVVKSVAGYDIHRSYVGSRGKFGIIIEVTLKVQPKPERFFRFQWLSGDAASLIKFNPSIVEVVEDALVVEILGYSEDVQHDEAIIKEHGSYRGEIAEEKWPSLVTRIREGHVQEISEDRVKQLFTDVARVFDPSWLVR